MGVKGLWDYVAHHQIIYQIPKDDRKGNFGFALRPQHLLLDMNAIMHVAFSSAKSTTQSVLQAVRLVVLEILRRVQPDITLVLVFDGVAPIAKIPTQKERRKQLPPRPPSVACSPAVAASSEVFFTCDLVHADIPLCREEIGAGSEFVCACEGFIVNFLCSMEAERHPLVSWKRRWLSSSQDPGEGEVKISCYIRRIWEKSMEEGTYSREETFSIVGNDSDLILVALVATPYRFLTIIDPSDFALTCIHELLEHWRRGVPNPPLPADLLPSYRIDFVFLMLLAGCDYYAGVRQQALQLWRVYRHLRANNGFFRRQLLVGKHFELDVEFLRRVMGREGPLMANVVVSKGKRATRKAALRGSAPGSAEKGNELLRATLWNTKGYVLGRCVDYEFAPALGGSTAEKVGIGSLRAAVQQPGVGPRIGAGATSPPRMKADKTLLHNEACAGRSDPVSNSADESTEANNHSQSRLSALEQYIAILGVRGRYSSELAMAIDHFTSDRGLKLTTSQSTSFLIATVKNVMAHVDPSRLTGAERANHAPSTWQEKMDPNEAALMIFSTIEKNGTHTGEA